ncbi:predicted protein [Uncinocarpus reesii 1704]|uniref:J domain-containing protein n=1 Tax=Uncinocarpus reesii (strain UAMH 1704) TaxID=336963 RepID=C4JTG1_UNCRE|nr:uncharacterized protein UREG_05750 [Uncinocarpus reesii 1704]EEP80908.1 predicted protein [Uncinocarpus reesii 1704]
MPSHNASHDYYAVLEVPQTADLNKIKSSYRTIAMVTHPDKNSNPDATAKFQLLHEAYSTLIDPIQRKLYDAQYRAKFGSGAPPATNSTRRSGPNEQGSGHEKQPGAELETRLRHLNAQRTRLEDDMRRRKAALNKLQSEIACLQADIKTREQAGKGTWWGFFTSILFGGATETDDIERQRDLERLQRIAARTVKENMLEREKAGIRTVETSLQSAKDTILSVEQDIRKLRLEEEEARRKAHQERVYREARSRMAEMRKKVEQEERARQARDEEIRNEKEAREREARARMERDAKKWARMASGDTEHTKGPCAHRSWWDKIDQGSVCSHCSIATRRFAFKCPDCGIMACATCRRTLKGPRSYASSKRHKKHKHQQQRAAKPNN